MCGIVGLLSKGKHADTKGNKAWFKQALLADTLRGFDSTGVFLASRSSTYTNKVQSRIRTTFKMATPGHYFISSRAFNSMMDSGTPLVLIGHNRAATKGLVTDYNAHPFTHGDITLVHNGSLTQHTRLPEGEKFAVDSEYICYSFSKYGVEETLKKIEGAFSLVWYDRSDDTVNFVRNSQRPMYLKRSSCGDNLYFSSEELMTDWLCDRNRIKTEDSHLSLPTGVWYKFNVDTLEHTEKEVEFHKYINTTNSYNRNNNYQRIPLIEDYGLKIGQEIKFSFLSTTIYPKSRTGKLEGRMYSKPTLNIVSYPRDGEAKELLGKEEITYNLLSGRISGFSGSRDEKVGSTVYLSDVRETDEFDEHKFDGDFDGDNKDNNIIYLNGSKAEYYGPTPGEKVTQSEYEELTKHGCCLCQGDILEADHEYIAWNGDIPAQPICPECFLYIDQQDAVTNVRRDPVKKYGE